MAVGSGMRLNGAMSILLVVLLVLGGMASMSSLEMNDASASDGNEANDKLQDNSKENSNDLLKKCENFREKNLDDDLGEWTHLREQNKFDWEKTRPVEFSTEGRQSSNSAINSTNNEVDWHLPDHITVVRTDSGYTISIIDDNGITITENYTEEDFTQFLVRFGWEPNTNDSEQEDDERDRGEIREMVVNLREACSNGDEDACRELRVVMERLRGVRDRADREEVPEISLEFLDDGTIVAHREFSDGNFEYDIISTGDNGDLTIVRVSAWGTEVIHPQPPKEDRRGEKGEKGNFESPHDFSEKMNDEDFRAKCQELLGDDERTPIDLNRDRSERESDRIIR